MSYDATWWDAEDIANGTPLSGSDKLVNRIDEGLYDCYYLGHEEGRKEGHEEALDEVIRVLELSGKPPEDIDAKIEWIQAQIEKERENRSQNAT